MAGKLKYTVLLAIFPVFAFAQTDTGNQRKVIVYNQDQYFGGYQTVNNVVKMNPLLIFTGDIPLYYERKLTENISAEGAIGVTTRNYLRELWDYASNPFYTEKQAYSFDDIIGKVGFSLRLAGRYYPASDVSAPHEFYFGPSIDFRRYNYAVPMAEEDPSTGELRFSLYEEMNGNRSFTDVKIMFGYSDFFEKNLMVEYYGGIGMRFISEDRFYIDEIAQPTGGNIPQTAIINDKKTVPIFSAGVKLGIGWE